MKFKNVMHKQISYKFKKKRVQQKVDKKMVDKQSTLSFRDTFNLWCLHLMIIFYFQTKILICFNAHLFNLIVCLDTAYFAEN